MSIRYLGSKTRLANAILSLVGPAVGGRFVDAFCGTGVVSREAARRGWSVLANDLLPSAATLTRAMLVTRDEARFTALGGYGAAVAALNDTPPADGFFAREYAPDHADLGRRYFTRHNARRLDGMRARVASWTTEGRLTPVERALLLGDLIQATNAVANTAGTYGCFLRRFAPNALRAVEVVPRELLDEHTTVDVRVGDAADIPTRRDDVVYLDPPYTKRQYAAYYHVLETLVAGDEPAVNGVTGLRPWRDRASDYCYKRRALAALADLVRRLPAARVLMSYSDEGHLSLPALHGVLAPLGPVTVHDLGDIRRYTPNDQSRARRREVREVVVEVRPS